ncbi:ScyD/ScyE family protein [Streptomyces sp. NPDC048514]|uniref:ScyD/ScyE family protein n=1 Tax=Streptomyces sp. NPDC048514 TaxID=3365564 RepID=UPI0037238A56
MSRTSKSWAAAFLAAAVVGSLTATVIPSQAASQAAAGRHGHRISSTPQVLATGLHNPRAVRIQSDGSLLVAEAGSGPATPCTEPNTQCLGFSGSIFRIKGAKKGRVVTGLPSEMDVRPDGESTIMGVTQAENAPNGTYRVVSNLSGDPDTRAALGPGSDPLGTLYIAKGKILGDLGKHEALHDPDSVTGNGQVFSNPWSFIRDGRDYLVVDAGANDMIRVHPDGTTETEAVFPNNKLPAPPAGTSSALKSSPVQALNPPGEAQAVPTGIVRGRDGAFYISDLSSMQPGISRIWRYVPGGKPTVFATGLTNTIGLRVAPNGDLIALSYATGYSSTGLLPGGLTRIDRHTGAATPIDTGDRLVQPTGLDIAANGDLYVTNNTVGNNGELLKFPAS